VKISSFSQLYLTFMSPLRMNARFAHSQCMQECGEDGRLLSTPSGSAIVAHPRLGDTAVREAWPATAYWASGCVCWEEIPCEKKMGK